MSKNKGCTCSRNRLCKGHKREQKEAEFLSQAEHEQAKLVASLEELRARYAQRV